MIGRVCVAFLSQAKYVDDTSDGSKHGYNNMEEVIFLFLFEDIFQWMQQ